MQLRILQLILLLKLGVLIPPGECSDCYVAESASDCLPDTICNKLGFYVQHQMEFLFEDYCSTVIFLKGVHEAFKTVVTCCQELNLKGLGPVEEVRIRGLSFDILSENVTVTNITIEGCTLLVTDKKIELDEQEKTIDITNCMFVSSSVVLQNAYLSVENSTFSNSSSTAITLYSSIVTFVGTVSFTNNTGRNGGALVLIGTTLKFQTSATVLFQDNYAKETGGAIFVDNTDINLYTIDIISLCFYLLEDYHPNAAYNISFISNNANLGGDHIYGGVMKSQCVSAICNCERSYISLNRFFHFEPKLNVSLSAVSSYPTRICTCDSDGRPQCTKLTSMFQTGLEVYPGAEFTISAVVVGGDFGTTTGTVYANFVHTNDSTPHPTLGNENQYTQVVTNNKLCTTLIYSVISPNIREVIYLSTSEESLEEDFSYIQHKSELSSNIITYNNLGVIGHSLLTEFTFINITLLPCPPGFSLTASSKCGCYPELVERGFSCNFRNGKGHMSWNSPMWIGLTSMQVNSTKSNSVMVSKLCPLHYCKTDDKLVDLQNNPDAQCDFNHSGILCGSCKAGLSLAVGSIHCIHCPNNKNLALLIFFAAAGILLIIAVSTLNLTVTQGNINGLIFYANMLWSYQVTLFPPRANKLSPFLRAFIAWLNLDFGIETCFIAGLDAFQKAWLQFVFPLYTATLFCVGLRYSSKLSKIFGDRSVPTLATLLFLSYTKLLRTIIAALSFVVLTSYPKGSAILVWTVDGNLPYGRSPHVFLLLTAIACLVLLWIPYTILLFSMQWLRRVDHYKPLRMIGKYKPLYDAYFAPLRDNHHYWFGVLLLAQGVVLLMSSLTYNAPSFSLIALLLISILLLCYLNCMRVYKRRSVTFTESSFLINFILLVCGLKYFSRSIITTASISIAFVEFCIIVLWNIIPERVRMKLKCHKWNDVHDQPELETMPMRHPSDEDLSYYVSYSTCDSVLEDTTTAKEEYGM